jgi:hypothetical protein
MMLGAGRNAMNRLLGSAAVLSGVLGALLPSLASAEIYGWIDPSGSFTYSNLPPPKNARVIEVIQEEPPPDPATLARAKAAADAAHQVQLQALNDRLRQLEREVQQVQRQPPPPVPYPVASAPPPGSGCDSDYFDCGVWSGPAYYTIGTLEPWRFAHHWDGQFRGTHHMPHHPGGGPGGGHRSGPSFHR